MKSLQNIHKTFRIFSIFSKISMMVSERSNITEVSMQTNQSIAAETE